MAKQYLSIPIEYLPQQLFLSQKMASYLNNTSSDTSSLMQESDLLKSRDAITKFLFIQDEPAPVDFAFVLGAPSISNIEPAIDLYRKGFTNAIVISGYGPKKSPDTISPSEAETLKSYAVHSGIPANKIFIEIQSTNTLENFCFSYPLIEEHFGWQKNKPLFDLIHAFVQLIKYEGPLNENTPNVILPHALLRLSHHSKIALNIHQFDTPHFEWQRLMHYGFFQGCCVVTESSSQIPGLIPNIHYFEDEISQLPALISWLINDLDGQAKLEKVRRAGYEAVMQQFQLSQSLQELFKIPVN